MKKKVLIIILAVLLVGLAVGGFFLVRSLTQKPAEVTGDAEDLTNLELLKLDSKTDLDGYIADHELVLQTSDDPTLCSVGSIPLAGQSMTLFFQTGEGDAFIRVDGMAQVSLEDTGIQSLKTALARFCSITAAFFEIDEDFSYSIYSTEGYELSTADDKSFEALLAGQASFGLSAVDTDGTYWSASALVCDGDVLQFDFFHDYASQPYITGSENILLLTQSGTEAQEQ